MNEPKKTTVNLPFSSEYVRIGRHLGNAIAGYRDGDFKRSASGMVDAVKAVQKLQEEMEILRLQLGEVLREVAPYHPSWRIWDRVRSTLARTSVEQPAATNYDNDGKD